MGPAHRKRSHPASHEARDLQSRPLQTPASETPHVDTKDHFPGPAQCLEASPGEQRMSFSSCSLRLATSSECLTVHPRACGPSLPVLTCARLSLCLPGFRGSGIPGFRDSGSVALQFSRTRPKDQCQDGHSWQQDHVENFDLENILLDRF